MNQNSPALPPYWDLMAPRFQHLTTPLRPCAEDLRIMQKWIDLHVARHRREEFHVLLFGVTPELVHLHWPDGTRLQAVDKSRAMINTVWPGNIPGRREVVCENWFEISRTRHSLDLIIGDGFLTAFRFPANYLRLADCAAQWLKPDGLLIIRLFSRPENDSMDRIWSDLQSDRIESFHALKLRLGMVLQRDVTGGVPVSAIYEAWKNIEAAFPSLCKRAGWSPAEVETVGLYEGRADLYAFPSVNELDEVWAGKLRRVASEFPGYELGDCCPILAYQPESGPRTHEGDREITGSRCSAESIQSPAPDSARSLSSVPPAE